MRNGMEVFIPFVSSYLNVTPPVLSIGFFEGGKNSTNTFTKEDERLLLLCFINLDET